MASNKQFAQSFLKDTPSTVKGILVIALIGGVGFGGYKIYQYFKKQEDEKKNREVVNSNKNEYLKLKSAGKKLTFGENVYLQLINGIITKFAGAETLNTELTIIGDIIKVVKTPIDWYYLVYKFGNRDIDDILYGKTNYELVNLLNDQLDTAGTYVFYLPNFKKTGVTTNSINILSDYLKKIGVTI